MLIGADFRMHVQKSGRDQLRVRAVAVSMASKAANNGKLSQAILCVLLLWAVSALATTAAYRGLQSGVLSSFLSQWSTINSERQVARR